MNRVISSLSAILLAAAVLTDTISHAFDGGDTPRSDPCEALSYHGFLGLEPAVVDAIARWIKATSGGA